MERIYSSTAGARVVVFDLEEYISRLAYIHERRPRTTIRSSMRTSVCSGVLSSTGTILVLTHEADRWDRSNSRHKTQFRNVIIETRLKYVLVTQNR